MNRKAEDCAVFIVCTHAAHKKTNHPWICPDSSLLIPYNTKNSKAEARVSELFCLSCTQPTRQQDTIRKPQHRQLTINFILLLQSCSASPEPGQPLEALSWGGFSQSLLLHWSQNTPRPNLTSLLGYSQKYQCWNKILIKRFN